MSVIYKAEIKFPSAETSRDILLERQFPSFKQDGIQLLFFLYIPHRNSNSVFGYNNRMLLIQGAYKRQKQTARAVASETELPDTSASSMARASGAVNKSLIVLSKVVYTP